MGEKETTLPIGVEEELAEGSGAERLRIRSIDGQKMGDDGLRVAVSLRSAKVARLTEALMRRSMQSIPTVLAEVSALAR